MAGWNPKANSIFLEARELPSVEAREEYLDQACGDDSPLRADVVALLKGYDDASHFFPAPTSHRTSSYTPDIVERPGDSVGPYKLLQEIGEGGMGLVFMAEQKQPVHRTVALKIIKPGMDTRQVVARFEAERQALALMDHPNIAKVFDAGATNAGRPYFVMELVKGLPITKYCDEQRLTLPKRLELFIPVCQAVQHAHQKGIIHRDLKPSNVMIALYDGRPVPKVIDFGVAKATGQKLTERTMYTDFGAVVGTLEYMSPEQAELNQLDVDTRSDIYSLGVLLYELLTGTTPLERNRLQDAALMELLRLIREEEPAKPSTRISTIEQLPNIAAQRGLEPNQLSNAIRGELDWIVMKALEKDRNRRYETANGLLRDIERFLADEPVQACPPNRLYRIKKFLQRNKSSALATAAIIVALVSGLALATTGFLQARVQAKISAAEAAKSNAINELLQSAMESANPDQAQGADYTVRKMLDDFAGRLSNQLERQPEIEAQLRATIGNAYRRLSLPDLSAAQFEAALALQRRAAGLQTDDYAAILVDYAQTMAEQLQTSKAESTVRQAIRIYRQNGTTGRALVKALWILQLQLASRAELAEPSLARSIFAEEQAIIDEALAISRSSGIEYPELANMLHRHAPLLSKRGNIAAAEAFGRRAVDMHRRTHGKDHPETAYGLADLGRVLTHQKKHAEAESVFSEAYEIFRQQNGADHPITRIVLDELNGATKAAGHGTVPISANGRLREVEHKRFEQPRSRSLRLAGDALERQLRAALTEYDKNGEDSLTRAKRLDQAATYRQLAEVDLERDDVEEAIAFSRTAVEITSQLAVGEADDAICAELQVRAQVTLAEALARAYRFDESMAALDAVVVKYEDAKNRFKGEEWIQSIIVDSWNCIASLITPEAVLSPNERAHLSTLMGALAVQIGTSGDIRLDSQRMLELADAYIQLGQRFIKVDDRAGVEDVDQRLAALLQSIVKKPATTSEFRELVGHNTRIWAFELLEDDGYQALSEINWRRAIPIFEQQSIDFPEEKNSWHFLADTHRRLGEVLSHAGNMEQAEHEYRLAVATLEEYALRFDSLPVNDVERTCSFFDLALLLVRTQRIAEATGYYRQGLDILERANARGGDVAAPGALAWRLASSPIEKFRDPPRATQLATSAIDIEPTAGASWKTLGVVQYRAGEWQAAVEALQKSIEFSGGNDIATWYFLAMAYWRLDQKSDARRCYDKAITLPNKNRAAEEELALFRDEAAKLLEAKKSSSSHGRKSVVIPHK